MALIEVSSVSKCFRIPSEPRRTIREHVFGFLRPRTFSSLEVLNDISFKLIPNETLGIMGGNGVGKSTLLKIICGVYPPDSGKVTLHCGITPILELGVGWNPELDAVDNILLAATIMGFSLKQAKQSIEKMLVFAELERFANLELKHFSSGMSARLAYSIAFHTVREVLILDEVFAVGDAGFKERCKKRFNQLRQQGHACILVSHDPSQIPEFCDRAILIDQGCIAMEASGREITDEYLRRLKGNGEKGPY
ncbi:MAG: ATP-binding cassette domain-containing protein [Pseudomonadota bacterium]